MPPATSSAYQESPPTDAGYEFDNLNRKTDYIMNVFNRDYDFITLECLETKAAADPEVLAILKTFQTKE